MNTSATPFGHNWPTSASPASVQSRSPSRSSIPWHASAFKDCAGKTRTFTRPTPQPDAWTWSYKREAEHFSRCLQVGEPVRSPAEDALTDMVLYEEIYKAFLKGNGVL